MADSRVSEGSGTVLLAGTANLGLAAAVAAELERPLASRVLERFPDGEVNLQLRELVRGRSVYLLQPTSHPVAEHLVELLLLADACWHGGAARITAVIPYFGYARQDRLAEPGQPLGARLMAELIARAHIDRCVVMDLHSPAIEGCFEVPVVHLAAAPLLIERVGACLEPNSVIVAPDVGATKRAERFARALDLPVVLVHKSRLSGAEVAAHGVTGDVAGMSPVIVDDMIATGSTVVAAARALAEHGCTNEITVVATHGLFVGPAEDLLGELPLRRLIVTDSVSVRPATLPVDVVSVAPLLAEEIRRAELPVITATAAGAALHH